MRELTLKELIKHKIVPFNVYNEKGQVIIYSGELLTPGKLLEIKELRIFLYDENYQKKSTLMNDNPLVKRRLNEKKQKIEKLRKERQLEKRPIKETFEMSPLAASSNSVDFDNVDTTSFSATTNKHSIISEDVQLKLKSFYSEILTEFNQGKINKALRKLLELTDKIIQEILVKSDNLKFLSEVKLVGEYQKCHALNVAIVAGLIGTKLEKSESQVKDLILSGLLHDIGTTKLNPELAYKKNLSSNELREYTAHTLEGYKIIKEVFNLKESIALTALEHHEYSDGSGYPRGISFDSISFESQVIIACNFYDNLTFNRTSFIVKNSRDAVKALLEMGSRKFSAEVLYTFANKFAFNDTLNFAQMIN